MIHLTPMQLGASLYIPATQPVDKLIASANGTRFPGLRSCIFCTEDAVRADELEQALANLSAALPEFGPGAPLLRFVRVRNPHVLGRVLTMRGITNVDGFVLPKVTRKNFAAYSRNVVGEPFWLMPTLETEEVFDQTEMKGLRRLLMEDRIRSQILSLRIGGNDLLNLLAVRRPTHDIIYDTALGPVIASLAGIFRPHGFNLSAPVFEGIENHELLRREVKRDLQYGLFGKTAIHPKQIPTIERCYAVTQQELDQAEQILPESAAAVFKMHDVMCEPSTQRRWAAMVVARAQIYGVVGTESEEPVPVISSVIRLEAYRKPHTASSARDDRFMDAVSRRQLQAVSG